MEMKFLRNSSDRFDSVGQHQADLRSCRVLFKETKYFLASAEVGMNSGVLKESWMKCFAVSVALAILQNDWRRCDKKLKEKKREREALVDRWKGKSKQIYARWKLLKEIQYWLTIYEQCYANFSQNACLYFFLLYSYFFQKFSHFYH